MRKFKFISLLCLLAVLCTSIVFAVGFANSAHYEWSEIDIGTEYYAGDTFSVPTATVSDGEKTYATQFVIKFPDGRSYTDADDDASTASEFRLSTAGVYNLIYSANVNGTNISKTVEFNVKERLFSVSDKSSSISYGEVEYVVPQGAKDAGTTKVVTGLNLKLASGDVFTYNKVVDLNELPEMLTLIDFYAIPSVDRELDVSGITVIITDAYDSSNVVEIQVKARTEPTKAVHWDRTYLSACAPNAGQITTGYAPGVNPELQVDTILGTGLDFTFWGTTWDYDKDALYRTMPIQFNYKQNAVYLDTNSLVADFDDPFFFSNLWEGFSTSKVFVSVVGNTYYKETCNLVITEFCGQDLAQVGADNKGELNTDVEPKFTIIDNGLSAENAFTLAGYKFPVFEVVAQDAYNGNLPITVRAFNGYYSSMRNEIDIVDGYITPNKLGLVTLEYTAKNYLNKVYKKTIDVAVVGEKTMKVELGGSYATSGVAGEIITLADYSVTGNVGNIVETIVVTCNGEQIAVQGNSFKTYHSGEYVVSITAEDAIGQTETKNYTVNISANNNPMFFGDVIIPNYFIVGRTYKLPIYNAYDYSQGVENEVVTKIYVNGAELTSYTPSKEENLTIEYKANTQNGSSVKTYYAKAVSVDDDQKLDYSKYFVTENLNSTATTYGVNFSSSSGTTANASFINHLSAHQFYMEYSILSGKTSLTGLNVYLIDVLDANNYIKISIDTATYRVSVNDKLTNYFLTESTLFDTTGKSSASLGFDSRTNTLTLASSKYEVNDFKGFSGDLLKLKVEMVGIDGQASFSIRKLCNQALKTSIKKDSIDPIVSYKGTYNIYENINTELTIYKAVMVDVLNPLTQAYVSVKDASGNYVTALDGTLLKEVSADRDYKVSLNAYGTYVVQYLAKDFAGCSADGLKSNINVIDRIPPEIVIEDTMPTTAKIGDTIEIPKVTATDNIDTDLEISVILFNSYTGLRKVITEDKFKVTMAADYILTFVCYDSMGNVGSKTLTVKVEG